MYSSLRSLIAGKVRWKETTGSNLNDLQMSTHDLIDLEDPAVTVTSELGVNIWDELHGVKIPDNAQPEQEFLVVFNKAILLRLRCPIDARPGQILFFLAPPPYRVKHDQVANQSSNLNEQLVGTNDGLLEEINGFLSSKSETLGKHSELDVYGNKSKVRIIQAEYYTSPNVELLISHCSVVKSSEISNTCSLTTIDDRQIANRLQNSVSPDYEAYAVKVPDDLSEGGIFYVSIMGQLIRIICPVNTRGGGYIGIRIPILMTSEAPLNLTITSNDSRIDDCGQPISNNLTESDEPLYSCSIPNASQGTITRSNSSFEPSTSSHETCHNDLCPNPTMNFSQNSLDSDIGGTAVDTEIVPTVFHSLDESQSSSIQPSSFTGDISMLQPLPEKQTDLSFEAVVPEGVRPGDSFLHAVTGRIRVLVSCPQNAFPGQRIRFDLPLSEIAASDLPNLNMSYGEKGWMRTIRASDMKFIWLRVDKMGRFETAKRFDVLKSAFIRRFDSIDRSSFQCQSGVLSLIPASDATLDSNFCLFGEDEDATNTRKRRINIRDMATATNSDFKRKIEWFRTACAGIRVDFSQGHIRMNIRRECLLNDSIDSVMSLNRNELRKVWRFNFIGEPGVDTGGLSRDWYDLVTKAIFDPALGLWVNTSVDQLRMQINPSSGYFHENHLRWFRFTGRVVAKALFDNYLVSAHMVQSMYKYILGWPLVFSDLQNIDEEYYRHLLSLLHIECNELNNMSLDFTATEAVLDVRRLVELVPGGELVNVSVDNLPEYLEACWKYKMMTRTKSQLEEFLLGIYDVIPEPILAVFDYQELELLMCGIPNINIKDWRENTVYTGLYADTESEHASCEWFWELVDEMDQEIKARLLKFVTGTSGVPSGGFAYLQGNDGNIRLFTIHGVEEETCFYPRSHTCFNRLDLPNYQSKDLLEERLLTVITMVSTGFNME